MTESKVGAAVQKRFKAVVTKTDSGPHGGFDALVSVFGNVDSQGDVVVPGAFTRTLAEWGDNPIPVLWAHQFYDMGAFIGKATAEETSEGLLFHADYLDVDAAQLARKLMVEGLVTEFSWSGRIREGRWVEKEDEFWYEIVDVDLWEAGPCFKGANSETQLISVKSLGAQIESEREALTATDVAALKSVQHALGEVIAAAVARGEKPPAVKTDTSKTPGDSPGSTTTEDHTTEKAPAPAGAFVIPAVLKARLALSNTKGGS